MAMPTPGMRWVPFEIEENEEEVEMGEEEVKAEREEAIEQMPARWGKILREKVLIPRRSP